MRLTITLNDMPAWKQDMIDADFNYFQADCKFQVCEAIEKVKKSRSLSYRILRLIRRSSRMTNVTIESFLTNMEVLKNYKVFDYSIKHEENIRTVVEVDVNEDYFEVVQYMRQGNPFMHKMGMNKKEFIKRTEKELKKTYTKDLKIEKHE